MHLKKEEDINKRDLWQIIIEKLLVFSFLKIQEWEIIFVTICSFNNVVADTFRRLIIIRNE